VFATIQTLVPERMRAMSIALIYLFANLIGMGCPLAAGALSDAFRPWAGENSLPTRCCPVSRYFCAGGIYGSEPAVTRDLDAVQAIGIALTEPRAHGAGNTGL